MANLIATYTPGANRNDFTGYLGVRFRYTGASGLFVSSLGRNAIAGDTGLYTVYLVTDAVPPALIRSASVDLTGSTPGTFYYASCTPFSLVNNTFYIMWSGATTGLNFHDFSGCTMAQGDNIGGAYSSAPFGTTATGFGSNGMFVGVDFIYGPAASNNASSFFFGA